MVDGSRGTLLVWALAAALAGIGIWRLTDAGGGHGAAATPVRIDRSSPAGAAGAPSSSSSARGSQATVYVHVAGAVRRPGLVRVPAGARVAQAVARAGGPAKGAYVSGVNLAARVEDGQQVLVPSVAAASGLAAVGGAAGGAGAAGPRVTGGAAATPGAPGTIKPSLGSATVEQLDQLDGIGPTLAQRIVEYRAEHGGFHSLGELREVDGIGEKRFGALREALQP